MELNPHDKSPQAIRSELTDRLRARSLEIEGSIFARTRLLAEPIDDDDPAYLAGMHSAIAAAREYGFEGIEKGGEWVAQIPPELIRQARRAARGGVRLDTVLRRCAAGSRVLEEFIVAEAEGMPGQVLREILSDQGLYVDRLMESVAAEYTFELEQAQRASAPKQADQVLQLLEGNNRATPADIDYDFDLWHVGMILTGPDVERTTQVSGERLGYRSLRVMRDRETVWAWFGSPRRPTISSLERLLIENTSLEISVAIGEPRRRLAGWRLTHREAQVALQVALQRPRRFTRGCDVTLLAGVLRDETLVSSLLDTYLAPLEAHGNSGRILFETLRAYFASGGNAAAAGAYLGVTRHTVQRRIKTVEQTLGQLLHTCHAELHVALQIDELKKKKDGQDKAASVI